MVILEMNNKERKNSSGSITLVGVLVILIIGVGVILFLKPSFNVSLTRTSTLPNESSEKTEVASTSPSLTDQLDLQANVYEKEVDRFINLVQSGNYEQAYSQ